MVRVKFLECGKLVVMKFCDDEEEVIIEWILV